MKGAAFAAVALGAFVAVQAADDKVSLAQLTALFNKEDGTIEWDKYSPVSLGMNLNYDEMNDDELSNVAKAFVDLGLIQEEEVEDLKVALLDARMRAMLQTVTADWPQTMERVLKDENYLKFLEQFQDGFNAEALATIVGMKDGVRKALGSGKGGN